MDRVQALSEWVCLFKRSFSSFGQLNVLVRPSSKLIRANIRFIKGNKSSDIKIIIYKYY